MFTNNYLTFDEFGLKQVLCMNCSKPIKSRAEIKSNHYPHSIVREVAKHADYREIPVIFDDGKLVFIMVCDDCKFVDIGEKESKDISCQLQNALKLQLEQEGKLPELSDAIIKASNFNVLRKAEVAEVTAAYRGFR